MEAVPARRVDLPPQMHLFKSMRRDVSVAETRMLDISPSTSLDPRADVFEFNVPAGPGVYFHLRKCYLDLELRLVKGDGSLLTVSDKIGVINNLGVTLFRTVELTLNQRQFGSNPNAYHIKSYLENMIFRSAEAKNTYLKGELWYVYFISTKKCTKSTL